MQRLSLGSPAGRPSRLSAAAGEADSAGEKAAKAAVVRAPAPDRSIHLVPVLTLLCLLILFLLSHDPSVAVTDSPVLAAAAAATARSLEAVAAAGADATSASGGVYRRLKEDARARRQQQQSAVPRAEAGDGAAAAGTLVPAQVTRSYPLDRRR